MTKIGPGTTHFRWRIYRAASYVEPLALVDEAGAPLDLTGATIRALIGRSWLEAPAVELTIGSGVVVLDAAAGLVQLQLEPAQSSPLPLGPAVLELYVTTADGLKRLMLRAVGSVEQTQLAVLGDAVVAELVDGMTTVLSDLPDVSEEESGEAEFIPTVDLTRPAGSRSGRRALTELRAEINGAMAGELLAGNVAIGAVSPLAPKAIQVDTSFVPLQVIWLIELTCDAAGSATVTLSGVRRDTGATETVTTYNLTAEETLRDAQASVDHSSFSWAKTGAGAVTARVL